MHYFSTFIEKISILQELYANLVQVLLKRQFFGPEIVKPQINHISFIW